MSSTNGWNCTDRELQAEADPPVLLLKQSRMQEGTHVQHADATRSSFQEIVAGLTAIIGRKLTAYIGSVDDVRAVDLWIKGGGTYREAEPRLRFAYQVVLDLSEHEQPAVVQSWLTGINPELKNRTPIRLLREGDLEALAPELLGAVRAFTAAG
jgi:hypothetical protein